MIKKYLHRNEKKYTFVSNTTLSKRKMHILSANSVYFFSLIK